MNWGFCHSGRRVSSSAGLGVYLVSVGDSFQWVKPIKVTWLRMIKTLLYTHYVENCSWNRGLISHLIRQNPKRDGETRHRPLYPLPTGHQALPGWSAIVNVLTYTGKKVYLCLANFPLLGYPSLRITMNGPTWRDDHRPCDPLMADTSKSSE